LFFTVYKSEQECYTNQELLPLMSDSFIHIQIQIFQIKKN